MNCDMLIKLSKQTISFWYFTEENNFAPLQMNEGNVIPLCFKVKDDDFIMGHLEKSGGTYTDQNLYTDYFEMIKRRSKQFSFKGEKKPLKLLLLFGIELYLSHYIKKILAISAPIETMKPNIRLWFWFDDDIEDSEVIFVEKMFQKAGYKNIRTFNTGTHLNYLINKRFPKHRNSRIYLTSISDTLFIKFYLSPNFTLVEKLRLGEIGADPRVTILAKLILDDIKETNPHIFIKEVEDLAYIEEHSKELLNSLQPIIHNEIELSSGIKTEYKVKLQQLEDKLNYNRGVEDKILPKIEEMLKKHDINISTIDVFLVGVFNNEHFKEKLNIKIANVIQCDHLTELKLLKSLAKEVSNEINSLESGILPQELSVKKEAALSKKPANKISDAKRVLREKETHFDKSQTSKKNLSPSKSDNNTNNKVNTTLTSYSVEQKFKNIKKDTSKEEVVAKQVADSGSSNGSSGLLIIVSILVIAGGSYLYFYGSLIDEPRKIHEVIATTEELTPPEPVSLKESELFNLSSILNFVPTKEQKSLSMEFYLKAKKQMNRGEIEEAVKNLKESIKLHPMGESYILLADAYTINYDFYRSILCLELAYELDYQPKIDIDYRVLVTYFLQNDYDRLTDELLNRNYAPNIFDRINTDTFFLDYRYSEQYLKLVEKEADYDNYSSYHLLINEYFKDLNSKNLDVHKYFGENVAKYISNINVSPDEINELINSEEEYLDQNFNFIGKNSFVAFHNKRYVWLIFSCYRKSMSKNQKCRMKIEFEFDEQDKITYYEVLEIHDIVFD